MPLKVYNTLTRKKEEFTPLEPGKVKMYVCGPTVYNFIHIGNARPYVVFDTIRRYLEYRGYEVVYVQNFTDVDDKIIDRANKEGVAAEVIADRYVAEALADAEGLNIRPSTYSPRVTQEMPQIIEMVKRLIEKGFAYEKEGAVYFNTPCFGSYGKLSNKNLEELEAGARVEIDSLKQSPTDFVLWKPSKPGEPKWQSPWGFGRPGWHIECSAMAKRYLGDTIDIHAGGEDLIFPHHENEIAQSEAANGKAFARYWLHNGFINVDSQKMSKSKGNFFTMREIAERFPYDVVRFFLLSGHYRSPINFSDEMLKAAENGLNRIKTAVYNLQYHEDAAGGVLTETEREFLAEAEKFKAEFRERMDDDFNTADAIAAIFELVRFANANLTPSSSKELTAGFKGLLLELGGILGLVLESVSGNNDREIDMLIEKRQKARANKDWAAADSIRNELQSMGIILEDTATGVRWKRK